MKTLLFFIWAIIGAACFLSAPSAHAGTTLDYHSFAAIPVQHEGRIKPMDTLARASLKSFSGAQTIDGMSADAWLAESLFDPARAMQRPLFRILRPQLLDLPDRPGKRYSYTETAAALARKEEAVRQLLASDPKSWSDDQKEVMRLHENLVFYTGLLRGLSLVLPLNMDLPDTWASSWGLPEDHELTLLDLAQHQPQIQDAVRRIVARKGDDPARYDDSERRIVSLAFDLRQLTQGNESDGVFSVLPPASAANRDDRTKTADWHSPWQTLRQPQTGASLEQTARLLSLWQEAASAYLAHDADGFTAATVALAGTGKAGSIALELAYNQWRPLDIAMGLYAAALLLLMAARKREPGWLYKAGFAAGMAGLFAHAAAITARILILGRPPVGTLYESILFVAAVGVLVSMIVETRRRDSLALFGGLLISGLLLLTARGFAPDDTMGVLVAVLNTNFWLTTHVLCITSGYGLCIVTAFFAHAALFAHGSGHGPVGSDPMVRTLGLAALFFTAFGTALGGIWADQSWGRFWGWDPKENGALLIVLWLAWIYHGSLSGHLPRLKFLAAMAGLNIVVALSWFGVNLLNVGLHSYGFINGVAAGLAVFCVSEVLLIGWLWRRAELFQHKDRTIL